MNKLELEKRTKQFALKIIAFAATLPVGRIGDVIKYQLVKAGTSVGANYREANRAESRNDFIHKIGGRRKRSFGESVLGWRSAMRRNSATLNNANGYCKNLASY